MLSHVHPSFSEVAWIFPWIETGTWYVVGEDKSNVGVEISGAGASGQNEHLPLSGWNRATE
ncbi:MAG TPA: hypothetical protein VHS34_20170 [Terriglobales bacterium]|jgi:hypothetical protein|nr:hypothetical protein [Terriglobales bacterium]